MLATLPDDMIRIWQLPSCRLSDATNGRLGGCEKVLVCVAMLYSLSGRVMLKMGDEDEDDEQSTGRVDNNVRFQTAAERIASHR